MNWSSLKSWLNQPIDAATLAIFRIFFGGLMVYEVYRYLSFGRVYRYYIEPTFYFTYEFFPFVTPWPGLGMYLHFYAMGLFALGMMFGFAYRFSATGFFLTYTYVFLIDKAQHNNHYYLICLLAFLMIWVDAHRAFSLDKLYHEWRSEVIPRWHHLILRLQMLIVYFYAGIAKINPDWLQGEPLRRWLANRADYPVVGQIFVTEWAPYFFSYGGLFFDLLIGFALLWRPTRYFALIPMIFFHGMNHWLFNIGIFPYMALASTVLFFDPRWARQVINFVRERIGQPALRQPAVPLNLSHRWQQIGAAFFVVYITLQVFIPLRHWLYPGDVAWTEEGHRWSWRMKLRDKTAEIGFVITDSATGERWAVDIWEDLNDRQARKMSTRPDMIYQFAQHLEQKWAKVGVEDPIVNAYSRAGLNGRPLQKYFDETVDLTEVSYGGVFDHATWIIPIQYDLQGRPLAERMEN